MRLQLRFLRPGLPPVDATWPIVPSVGDIVAPLTGEMTTWEVEAVAWSPNRHEHRLTATVFLLQREVS